MDGWINGRIPHMWFFKYCQKFGSTKLSRLSLYANYNFVSGELTDPKLCEDLLCQGWSRWQNCTESLDLNLTEHIWDGLEC